MWTSIHSPPSKSMSSTLSLSHPQWYCPGLERGTGKIGTGTRRGDHQVVWRLLLSLVIHLGSYCSFLLYISTSTISLSSREVIFSTTKLSASPLRLERKSWDQSSIYCNDSWNLESLGGFRYKFQDGGTQIQLKIWYTGGSKNVGSIRCWCWSTSVPRHNDTWWTSTNTWRFPIS